MFFYYYRLPDQFERLCSEKALSLFLENLSCLHEAHGGHSATTTSCRILHMSHDILFHSFILFSVNFCLFRLPYSQHLLQGCEERQRPGTDGFFHRYLLDSSKVVKVTVKGSLLSQ